MWLARQTCLGLLVTVALAQSGFAQKYLTWEEVRTRFEAANPTLHAGQIGVDESRADEITAYLRPNPNMTLLADQIDPFPGGPAHGPFAFFLPSVTFSYLHERQHKRELRLDFLDAQADYRAVQLSYLNLVGSYLEAANPLNLAVGREVLP